MQAGENLTLAILQQIHDVHSATAGRKQGSNTISSVQYVVACASLE
jgi:hypothetical protein